MARAVLHGTEAMHNRPATMPEGDARRALPPDERAPRAPADDAFYESVRPPALRTTREGRRDDARVAVWID